MSRGYQIYKTKFEFNNTSKKLMKLWKNVLNGAPFNFDNYYKHDGTAAIQFDDALAQGINAEEIYYLKNGKKNIFLSTSVCEMLLRAKFTSNENATIAPLEGLESFALALPKNSTITLDDGQEVPLHSCLVTAMSSSRLSDTVHADYTKATDIPIWNDHPNQEETLISICYNVDGVAFHSCVPVSQTLPYLTKGVSNLSHASQFLNQQLTPAEKKVAGVLFRLVAAFLIYTSATNGKNIVKGYPQDGKIEIPKGYNLTNWSASYIDMPKRKTTPASKQRKDDSVAYTLTPHTRPAHMRNLQDERFYRGKYANLPEGSRWVMVDQYDVGDLDAHHMKQA